MAYNIAYYYAIIVDSKDSRCWDVKQGKGGGVSAYPEIAADFHLWLDPKARLAIFRTHIL